MAQEAYSHGDFMDVGNKEKVSIVGRNLAVTPAMREHTLLKISKLEELTPHVIGVVVHLEIQREEHKAEILYKFSHFSVVVHAVKNDMYQAIDLAVSRLRRKLMKWKTKILHHHGKKLSEIEMDIHVIDTQREMLFDINDQIEDETQKEVEEELKPAKVVKREKRSVPMLTMDEASMRMDLSDDHFMVYRSEEDQKIKVMYTLRDHTLGILEVE